MGTDPHSDEAALERAAAIIRDGGLVGMPTETVYGLGASALSEDAAVKVVAAWSTLGGSCSYGDCRFDGDCELYVLPVLGVWEEEEIII